MMKRRTNVLLDIGSHVVLVISTIISIFTILRILQKDHLRFYFG